MADFVIQVPVIQEIKTRLEELSNLEGRTVASLVRGLIHHYLIKVDGKVPVHPKYIPVHDSYMDVVQDSVKAKMDKIDVKE